jgi:hypothetical protein
MVFMVFLLRLLNRTDNIAAHFSAPSPMPKIDFNFTTGTQHGLMLRGRWR